MLKKKVSLIKCREWMDVRLCSKVDHHRPFFFLFVLFCISFSLFSTFITSQHAKLGLETEQQQKNENNMNDVEMVS